MASERQTSCYNATLVELTGNQPCGVLGKAAHRDMCRWRQSAYKGAAGRSCWPLALRAPQQEGAGEAVGLGAAGHRGSLAPYRIQLRWPQNKEAKLFSPVMSL